jgi:trans-aconitate methyltransferase
MLKNRSNKLFRLILYFAVPRLNSRKWEKSNKKEILQSYNFDNTNDLFDKLITDSIDDIPFKTLIEFGCHKGSRLVSLSRKYPERNFLGIELNKTAVSIGSEYLSKKSILNVTLLQGDISKRIDLITNVDVLLSCATLIYISPVVIRKVIKNMIQLNPNYIVLIEVCGDFDSSIKDKLIRKYRSFPNWEHNYRKLFLAHDYELIIEKEVDRNVWSPGGGLGRLLIFELQN